MTSWAHNMTSLAHNMTWPNNNLTLVNNMTRSHNMPMWSKNMTAPPDNMTWVNNMTDNMTTWSYNTTRSHNMTMWPHNMTTWSYNTTAPEVCLLLDASELAPWDDPENVVSSDVEELAFRLKSVVFLPLFFIIGFCSNLIFWRQGLRERINMLLWALSLADGLYMLSHIVMYGEQLGLQFTTKERYGHVLHFLSNHYLLGFYGFHWVSEVITAIIATDRCICVLWPLRAHNLIRTKTLAIIVSLVSCVIVGVYSVVMAKYRTVCVFNPTTNSTTFRIFFTDFYTQNAHVLDSLDAFVYGTGLPGVVMVTVAIATVVTVVKLRHAVAWRAKTSSEVTSSKEAALTKMLVANSVFFMICVLPVAVFRVIWSLDPEMAVGRHHHNSFMLGVHVLDILSYANASFSFVIYYVMGSRYRETLKSMLGRKGRGQSEKSTNDVLRSTVGTTNVATVNI